VGPGEAGRRLVDVLQAWLAAALNEPVPMARVRALVRSGGVRVRGMVVRAPGRPMRAGDDVTAAVDRQRLQPRARLVDRPFTLTRERILLDDGVLLAVDKPAGLPTHATADRSRPSLAAHVERWLREQGRPATPAVHQRLDRDTSGIVLLGVDPRANAGLARAFAGREAEKAYLALVARPARLPARAFRVDAPIGPAGAGREGVRVGRQGADAPAAQPAETEVVVREVLERALLVEARPRTGRRHQVRVHLAHAGLPILGDPLYGRRDPGVPRLMLHATRLALPHPATGAPLVIECPLPEDFVGVLGRLRRGESRE